MVKLKIAKILSFLVVAIGLMVIVGWLFNIDILKSILPNSAAMKFTVAMCFVTSGLILYSIIKNQEGVFYILQIIMPALVLFILLLMVTVFLSAILGFKTGIDNFLVKEQAGAVMTITPGRPSMAAMINLIFIAIIGLLVFSGSKKQSKYMVLCGWINVVTGVMAIIGYTIGVPFLYYYIPNINTALAFPAAIAFILIGSGFILCGKNISE